ncbi:MAG: hypothetical protein GEU75_13465 [Dehalococcoidia bacterium]|nr:hypothetical protein [Dehalococcoidia bacterium]
MATTAARPRSARLAAPAWLNPRLLLGAAIFTVAVGGGLVFWGAARDTVPVLVAATDLPPGHVLRAEDLSVAEVRVEGPLAALSISEAEMAAVVGRPLSSGVHGGAMLLRPDLATGEPIGPNEVAITVPVAAEAVYAGLRRGDAVAVLATRDIGTANSQTSTLLDRVVVYELTREPGRVAVSRSSESGGEERGLTNVTLIVPRSEAERLAHALVNWEVTLAILPPGPAEGAGP